MPISESSFNNVVKELIKEFTKNNSNNSVPNKFIISSIIYNNLTLRKSPEDIAIIYNTYYKSLEQEYKKHLSDLGFDNTVKFESNPVFLEFASIIPAGNFMQRKRVGLFKILYKEYFTFAPKSKNPRDVFREILQFLDALPELHRELYKLSISNFDKVDFKIPITLRSLLQTPDSIVIHYRNKNLSHHIRETTNKIFLKRGISFANRFFRVNHGFDFSNDDLSYSHSEIISRVLANHIIKHYDSFLSMSEQEIIAWLKASIKECNKWTEQQLHDAM